jgi:hypothetical protein
MPSKTVSTINRVRYRVVRADAAWREALEVLREAAAIPDYRGPDLQAFERVAAGIDEARAEIRNWGLEESLREPPRRSGRPGVSRPAVRQLIAEIAGCKGIGR